MNVFELFGKIAINGDKAMSGIDQTVGHAKKAESSLAKTFKKIGTVVAAAFSVKAVVDFGKSCTQAYASIAAEESAFAQIMGDYADTAQAKLNAVADQTGVSATRMTGAMTSLTAKFKGLGYDTADATTLAADGLLIAADAAAFWDMSLDESMSHLNSFINGSYEGGEAIGLFANDTQMAAYAIEQGIVKDAKAWAALDEAQRQATRLLYAKQMMENSGATGQAAKEADAYANVMANLKESWRQFQGVVGKPILEKFVLPAMKKLNAFMPTLTESVQNGIVWLEEGFEKVKGYFTEVFTEDGINMDALPNAVENMFRDLGKSAGKLLHSFGQMLRSGWTNTVWPAIQGVAAKIGIELPGWPEIETKVKAWWENNGLASAIAGLCNWTLNLFGAPSVVTAEDVSAVLSSWWESTKGLVQSACTWVLGLFGPPQQTSGEGNSVGSIMGKWWQGVRGTVQGVCQWTLGLFGPPKETDGEGKTAVEIITEWWNGIKGKIEEVCMIDLSQVNIAGIFTSATDAYNSFIGTCTNFVNDVLAAVSSNEPGETVLSARLSNLFDAGAKAIAGILSSAATLVSGVVGAITGKEEDAKKIGEVFSELFGVASEVLIGVKDGAVAVFDWFLANGETVTPIIKGVATAMAMFALAKPAVAIIAALSALIAVMTVDWGNFEKNYPQLAQMLEDLTGLDFTDVATSLTGFQDGLNSIVTWFGENKAALNTMLVLLGGLAMYSGHWVAGTALIMAGGYDFMFNTEWLDEHANKFRDSDGTFNPNLLIPGLDGMNPDDDSWQMKPRNTLPPNIGDSGFPGIIAAAIQTALATLPADVKSAASAGVAEGVGNITITGSITTGNVTLDSGVLVGQLAPRIDLKLGGKFGRASV